MLDDPEFSKRFSDGLVTRKALDALPEGLKVRGPTVPYFKMVGLGCRASLPDTDMLDDQVIDELIEIFRVASQLVRYFDW